MAAVLLTLHSAAYLAWELPWASAEICSVMGSSEYVLFKALPTKGTFNGLT